MAAKKKSKRTKKSARGKKAATKRKTKSRAAASKRTSAKTKRAKKTAKRKTTKRSKPAKAKAEKAKATKKVAAPKGEFGEGNYKATREFDKAQTAFVAKNRAKIPEMGREAADTLDGPQGVELERAEQETLKHARG